MDPPESVQLPPLRYGEDDVVEGFEFHGDARDVQLKASAKTQGWILTTRSSREKRLELHCQAAGRYAEQYCRVNV